jgi:hypothetical protein
MTWSINWDAVASCAAANEFAQAYEDLFGDISTGLSERAVHVAHLWPSPATAGSVVHLQGLAPGEVLQLRDASGRLLRTMLTQGFTSIVLPADLRAGHYLLHASHSDQVWRLAVVAP